MYLKMKYSDELVVSSAGNYQWMATSSEYFKRDMWGLDLPDLLKTNSDGGIWGLTVEEQPIKCRKGEYFFYKVFYSLFSSKMKFPVINLFNGDTNTSFDNVLAGDFDCEGMMVALKSREFSLEVLLTVTEKEGNFKQTVLPFSDYVDRGGSQYLRKALEKKIEKGDQITTDHYSLDYQEFNPTPVVAETSEHIPF